MWMRYFNPIHWKKKRKEKKEEVGEAQNTHTKNTHLTKRAKLETLTFFFFYIDDILSIYYPILPYG